ncbi:hypothetical protein NC653_010842 [Populus alba x Populus x berolinensis]|uniref:Uncharacterized protein n=1 Tax=Populus alba x Populus x berolinensis TaxID=444605 RepID=A0AAD6W5M4_9ROSI|nr:hypothetical protein NC653_010842 [Populus alba x Populus x berolinensis]
MSNLVYNSSKLSLSLAAKRDDEEEAQLSPYLSVSLLPFVLRTSVWIFADMEELGLRPSVSIVSMVGKGERVRIRAKPANEFDGVSSVASGEEETSRDDAVDVVKDVANEDEEASSDVKVVGSSFLQARILRVAVM